MGEYEATIERLNKVLTTNGFSEVLIGVLSPSEDKWYSEARIPLRFDESGKYIKPVDGTYYPVPDLDS
jgi:hypothetical protein